MTLKKRVFGAKKPAMKKVATKEEVEQIADEGDVEGLLAALKHRDSALRAKAAEELCKVDDERAVKPLAHALRHDQAWLVRRYAAEALGNIGDPEALEPLTAAANEDPYRDEIIGHVVRNVAKEALDKFQRAKTATSPLQRLLTRRWSTPDPSEEVATLTRVLVGHCVLSQDDRDVSTCLRAIEILAGSADARAAEVMCYATLQAGHSKVREAAAGVLRNQATPETIAILCEALDYDRQRPLSFWSADHALDTLRIIGDSRATGAIIRFLNDFRERWRRGDGMAVRGGDMFTLGAELQQESTICLDACRALAALGGSEAIAAIEAVLADSYWGNYSRDEVSKLISGTPPSAT